MNNEHPIENLMKSTMENIRNMVDVNTIIGDTVETKDGSNIIPISKVSFGFASGGSEFNHNKPNEENDRKYPFGGGCGAGVSVKPVAFLVIKNDSIRILPVDVENSYDRLMDYIPQVMDFIKDTFNKISESKNANKEENKQSKVEEFDATSCSINLKEE